MRLAEKLYAKAESLEHHFNYEESALCNITGMFLDDPLDTAKELIGCVADKMVQAYRYFVKRPENSQRE